MDSQHVLKINLGTPTQAHTAARAEAARLWNHLVRLHKFIRKRHWPWPNQGQLEKHFKGRYPLHSQTIQGLIGKFIANIDSTRSKRKQGDKDARYPWRDQKRFQTVLWKGQAIKRNGNTLTLPMKRGQKPIRIRLPKGFPDSKISQVELGFRELSVTLCDVVTEVFSAGNNWVAGDPGIIHQMTLTDGEASLAIVGRGLRSLVQGKHKKLAHYSRALSKTKKGSRQNRKLKRHKARYLARFENQQRNLLHHSANQVLDFCVERQAGTLVVGDIASIAKNKRKTKKGSRRSNQENSSSPIGILYDYLTYKGALRGVKLEKINEAHTSQTCPVCGHRHKPTGRIYKCRNEDCDFVGIRDDVGAANILNKHKNNGRIEKNHTLPTGKVKYLRPVKLASRSVVDRLADGMWLDNTLDLDSLALAGGINMPLNLLPVA